MSATSSPIITKTPLPEAARTWLAESQAAPLLLCQLTPHTQRYLRVPQLPPPKYALYRVLRDNRSQLFERRLEWSAMVRCRRTLPRELGLDIGYMTLLRLYDGGFIRGTVLTPGTYLLDLTSIHEHLVNASKPGWWTPERKMRYSQSIGYGGASDSDNENNEPEEEES